MTFEMFCSQREFSLLRYFSAYFAYFLIFFNIFSVMYRHFVQRIILEAFFLKMRYF